MPRHTVILDSGAFGVWNSGATIDLRSYIQFCKDHPKCPWYVNLDVIPGEPNNKRSLTKDAIESACFHGFRNWMNMGNCGVPRDKIIPVYHQNDPVEWLDKYLDAGVQYIGISPANDNTTQTKMEWMETLRPFLFDGAGRPVVKTHGFAVTSYDLMKFWDWYSVDSASWKLAAAWGAIYLPRRRGGQFDYSVSPLQLVASPNTLAKQKRSRHTAAMPKGGVVYEQLTEYLAECGTCFGESKQYKVGPGYKLNKEAEEFWVKKPDIVARVIVPGVTTSFRERAKVNARFMQQANKVLPVEHLYLAGATMPDNYDLEPLLYKRLVSYHEVGRGKRALATFRMHLDRT